ncbi:MAG TPA: formylglycine-generating enzyme family protein [Pseudoxanthomonas sp.]|nr:formylglycine-generating enzyme family protein [Pseudoxanthomonas sp.]
MHSIRYTLVMALALSGACARAPDPQPQAQAPASRPADPRLPSITISGDDSADPALNWQPPAVSIDSVAGAKARAAKALSDGHLFESAEDAIPIYLALRTSAPDDRQVAHGLERALAALLKQGREALAEADDDLDALERSLRIASVARTLQPDSQRVAKYLDKVDLADQLWRLNAAGELALSTGEIGQGGELALVNFLQVLRLVPGQPRAMQGVAATESALIRRAEDAAQDADFAAADRWLRRADEMREDPGTIADARQRIEAIRNARIAALRQAGLSDLTSLRGQRAAREFLAEVLRIAPPGDPAAADFRNRIDLATHYGLFRPGEVFSDSLADGGRGPVMTVVPHGGFRMGATEHELGAADAEKPAHYVRFDRGFAVSRTPVTVGEFRRFVQATDYRPRATRRGHSIVYDERSGNFVRRSGVDWQSDYAGARAADSLPVLHVSVRDAEAYAAWLSEQTGHGYRLPSEAEYEYVLRAGVQGRYPWGRTLPPPPRVGNLTGGNDVSPSGRRWNNAFVGYGDGYWGPAPAGSYSPNPWGLYDVGSNVSEWVSDCWHASYRRAPADGASWFNPGCRSRVTRGGSWASSPVQARAAWRASSDSDMTNARVGFRMVRGI